MRRIILPMVFLFVIPLFAPAQDGKSGFTSTDFIIWAICSVVGFLLFAWLADWIWGVSKRNRLLKIQVQLLIEIAKQQGVDSKRLEQLGVDADSKGSLLAA